jgi:methionyl-tRNA formyltransferase
MKFSLLVSGNLGYQILKKIQTDKEISFVLTDSNSEDIIQFCSVHNIPIYLGNPRNGKSSLFLEDKSCDVILSINYLYLIDEDIIQIPSKYAINFHGSLLPKYRGRTPHVWAIINNETITGITAHLIDADCDTGDIIEQIVIEITQNDTGASILEKFNEKYWDLVQSVLVKIEKNQLEVNKQDQTKATYFGKRTPDDGLIDWDWQKERIRNWVRAQADPYPGAFILFQNEKIIFDEISFVEDGFSDNIRNGQILSIHPLKIKTQNGVIQVDKYRGNLSIITLNSIIK